MSPGSEGSPSLIVPTLQRGGKGTGFVGSPWATENPVTRFPMGEGGAAGTKGAGTKSLEREGRFRGLWIALRAIIIKSALRDYPSRLHGHFKRSEESWCVAQGKP